MKCTFFHAGNECPVPQEMSTRSKALVSRLTTYGLRILDDGGAKHPAGRTCLRQV